MTTQARKFLSWLAVAAALVGVLTACGGSSNDDDIDVEFGGAISGPLTGDPGGRNVFNLLVLENNVIYGLYGTDIGGGLIAVDGFLQGNAAGSSTSYTSANSVSFFGSATGVSTPFISNYSSSTVTGTITQAAVMTRTFAATAIPTAVYNYNAAASTSTVSGTFANLQDLTGKAATLNVVGGTFSGTIAGGCVFSGVLSPRASGVNVFDVTITYGAAPCDFPATSFTGAAISLNLAGGTQELLLTAVNAGRTRGVALIGTR